MTNNIKPIGEIIEIIDSNRLNIELYNADYSFVNGNMFMLTKNNINTLFIGQNIFKEPIDKSRRAVALNLSYDEIMNKYPQNKFIIKNYMSLFVLGSIIEKKFIGASQLENIGIHDRIFELSTKEYGIFVNDQDSLYSLFLSIYNNNRQLLLTTKSFLKKLINESMDKNYLSILLKTLSVVLKNEYLLLKDLVSDLN